ncbi:hypothetical protein GGS20DRAFT_543666 [Poronia punctata]|nr:hypothetical protein GGS20DRAFT_543666 [Poronia punctata]
MPPLILHNVPDEELYTGEDGVQRPYAMVWPDGDRQRTVPRTRARELNETGSFGKSTRRSRSRTGSAQPKREDATMQNADKIFSKFIASQQQNPNAADGSSRNTRQDDANATNPASSPHREPVEVILRGYASPSQQYAAISQYEHIGGRICEDYSREPPIEARRYKSDLRDPALTRRQALTHAEREKVNKVAGGEHWIKVTFESQEAAAAALAYSPQKIMGHLVYAEQYHNRPPLEDTAVLELAGDIGMFEEVGRTSTVRERSRAPLHSRNSGSQTLPRSFSTNRADRFSRAGVQQSDSPVDSQMSSVTMDSATVSASSAPTSSATTTAMEIDTDGEQTRPGAEGVSRLVPGARRIKLLPADAALKRQPSFAERMLALIPLLGWFSGAVIGNEVPRTELGEFDLTKASLYWKIMYWLDYWFHLFGNELVSNDKED